MTYLTFLVGFKYEPGDPTNISTSVIVVGSQNITVLSQLQIFYSKLFKEFYLVYFPSKIVNK